MRSMRDDGKPAVARVNSGKGAGPMSWTTNGRSVSAVAAVGMLAAGTLVWAQAGQGQAPSPLQQLSRRTTSTMTNPYRMLENWPTLRPGQEWGAAIGLIPDGTGGTWMMFRSEPPINYITADGQITKSFGDGMIVQAHGLRCRAGRQHHHCRRPLAAAVDGPAGR
jgi:hypothetical protein